MSLKPISICLAGFKIEENQISRALRRYPNVTVYWTDPDPGAFKETCDTAVIAIAQCSHKKYNDVKETYKGRPTFVIREGFSEMKEKFERWLDGLPVEIKTDPALEKVIEATEATTPGLGSFAHAFEQAMKKSEVTEKEEKTVTAKRLTPNQYRIKWIKNYIMNAKAQGIGPSAIARSLNELGLRRKSGRVYKTNLICAMQITLRKRGFKPDPAMLDAAVPTLSAPLINRQSPAKLERTTIAPPAPKPEAKNDEAKALIDLVIGSDKLDKEKKLELLKVLL